MLRVTETNIAEILGKKLTEIVQTICAETDGTLPDATPTDEIDAVF